MNITRRFLLWGAAAVAAVQSVKPVAAALPPAPPPVPAWVPEGWLPCWGQSVSRKTYAKLFEVIGTTYGAADDDTFSLPDMRARYIAALGGSMAMLNDPGHSHSIAAVPTHTHSISEHTHIAPTITLESVIATGDGPTWAAGFVAQFAGRAPTS